MSISYNSAEIRNPDLHSSKDNKAADSQSRKINLDAEWKLNPNFIANALEVLHFEPNGDLFASGINFQYKDYFSF